ncbi:unnamed protein product [Cunninghamella echinulata]
MAERAKESMVPWRLILNATIIKKPKNGNDIKFEEDIYYLCEFSYINQKTMEFYFTVKKIEAEGGVDMINDTPIMDKMTEFTATVSTTAKKVKHGTILMPFGSETSLNTSILKENISTKLLEYGVTLSDNYSFHVCADDYADLSDEIDSTFHYGPDFILKYHIQRLQFPSNRSIHQPQPPFIPDIALHFDSLCIAPNWWWLLLKEHGTIHPIFGLEHAFW